MSQTISIAPFPATLRPHGTFAVINPNGANTGQENHPTVIIGQVTSAGSVFGTAAIGVPVLAPPSDDQARQIYGAGSNLVRMLLRYRAQDPIATIYVLPLQDDPASVAATATVAFPGTTSAAGVLSLYIDGVLVPIALPSGSGALGIATAITAAVTSAPDLPVTAAVSGNGTVFSAKNKGLAGNGIDLRLNYVGAVGGEVLPAGLTTPGGILLGTGTQLSGGQQNPSLTSALSALPAQSFDCYVTDLNDPTSLNVLQTFLDGNTGRWSYLQMLYGGVFTAYRGTLSSAVTFGLARNDPAMCIMPCYDSPESPTLWAADMAGTCMASLRADPALPLQELLLGVLPAPAGNRFDTLSIRNTLLYSGMSTHQVNQAGQVYIDRAITTYQTAPSGAPDDSYLDVETRYSLAALIRDMQTFLRTTYARKKLVADGTNIAGGSNMVTAQTILSSAWGKYRTWCDNGQAQNYATFKANSRAENQGNGRVALLLPIDLANQLRQIVLVVDFLKS